tara:strand:+ start:369 stop:1322 length:954 start_codon:yes stop_codon:yes gene_type:complete
MKKSIAIIVGGTGQFGVLLAEKLLKKKYKVIITTRSINKAKKKIAKKKINIKKLDIFNKNEIKKLLFKYKPGIIFYTASQSSPGKSFEKKKETYLSNYIGCKNFLEIIKKNKFDSKFINFSSCEIYGNYKKKISVESPKKPISPYGFAKLKAHNKTKYYREKYNLKFYNAIIFNTESLFRPKNFLVPKICIAAINAKKKNIKTEFGNLNISREWNWCEEQCKYLMMFINREPQDFILSNGKSFSAIHLMKLAFSYFNLDYKKYILVNKKFMRKKDSKIKISNYRKCLRRNKIIRKDKFYGKKMIYTLIRYYLHEKKY